MSNQSRHKMKFNNPITFTIMLFLLLPVFTITAQDGEALFKQNCAACHKINKQRMVGPGLEGIADKRNETWLANFIKNSQSLIKSGDADAIAIYEEYNKTLMPPFEHLSDAEIKAIIDYMPGSAKVATTDAVAEAPAIVYEYTADDIEQGKMLYIGTKRFANKGQSCISCHNVTNNEIIPGGLLSKDLTNVYARMGHEGITGLLGSPPFPAMATSYSNNKLSDEEIFQLTAFLKHADEVSTTQQARTGYGILLIGGFSGLLVFLILIGIGWKNRKKEMVKHDIFRRQLRGRDSVVY